MAFSTNQKEVTYATLVGYEPALFKASDEALFTDPLDCAVVPKLQKKRFPSLATLRAEKASVELLYAVGSEHVVHADDRCYQKTSLGSMCQKDVVESMAKHQHFNKRYGRHQLKVLIWLALLHLVFGSPQHAFRIHTSFLTR